MMKPAIKQHRHERAGLSLFPYSVWAFLFILVPLFFVAYYAFTDENLDFFIM